MTQHYCQRMVWRTWLLFHSRLALVLPSLNSSLVCSATKGMEHNCKCRFPQKMSGSLVVKAWPSPCVDLHRKGELCTKAVCCEEWCMWRCPVANRRLCSLWYLAKHHLKVLLNLAVIGKPWAYVLATCSSKALWSLIWAKACLLVAVTGVLEA